MPDSRSPDRNLILSRRQLFPTLAGGLAVAGAAVSLSASEALAQKATQKTAGYQDHPNKGQSCSQCRYFMAPHSCQLVQGTISPNGWCTYFLKKS